MVDTPTSNGCSGLATLLVACMLPACSDDDERPPHYQGDGGGSGARVPVTAISPDGSGQGGAAAAADLTGSVVAFQDDGFGLEVPFSSGAEVAAPAADGGGFVTATAVTSQFALSGVEVGEAVWMAARPDATNDAFFGAWTVQDTTLDSVDVPVVPADIVDEVLETLIVPTTPSPTSGHLVLRVVDEQNRGVAGVALNISGAEFVSYKALDAWTDGIDRTEELGWAFAGNVLVKEFPGQNVNVVLGGQTTQSVDVQMAAGMVTVIVVQVD